MRKKLQFAGGQIIFVKLVLWKKFVNGKLKILGKRFCGKIWAMYTWATSRIIKFWRFQVFKIIVRWNANAIARFVAQVNLWNFTTEIFYLLSSIFLKLIFISGFGYFPIHCLMTCLPYFQKDVFYSDKVYCIYCLASGPKNYFMCIFLPTEFNFSFVLKAKQ